MHIAETPTNLTYQTPESGNPDTPRPISVPEPERPDLSTRINGDVNIADLETMKRVLGEEHPSTLTSMANPATTYWSQGRWTEAKNLEIFVMEASKRMLGEEHPETLISTGNLATPPPMAQPLRITPQKPSLPFSPEEGSTDQLDEYFPLGLDDWMPPVDAIYRPHIVHHTETHRNQGRRKEVEKLGVQALKKDQLYEYLPLGLDDWMPPVDAIYRPRVVHHTETYRNQGRCQEAEKLGVQARNILTC